MIVAHARKVGHGSLKFAKRHTLLYNSNLFKSFWDYNLNIQHPSLKV